MVPMPCRVGVVLFPYREAYYLLQREPPPGSVEHLTWEDKLAACKDRLEINIAKQRQGVTGVIGTDSRVLPVLPVAEPLGRYVPATLALSKGLPVVPNIRPMVAGTEFASGIVRRHGIVGEPKPVAPLSERQSWKFDGW